ncbi:MAG: hypothetical protein ABIX46_09785 [Burkholderiaceae bacterium]
MPDSRSTCPSCGVGCGVFGEAQIADVRADADDPDDAARVRLQSVLGCDTWCGSCVPELRRRVRARRQTA